jgi:exopolysaccharide production protein ExoZ
MQRLVSIQHLRGLAVLGVVIFHAFQWEWLNFETGAGGVDLFFIISGFVMWVTTADRDMSPGDFLKRRAARVVPLYWLASLIALISVLIWPGWIPNVIPNAQHVLLSLAFIPHLDPKGGPFPLLNPGWTLTYEAFFYLVFAVILLAPQRWRPVILTVVMLCVFWFGFNIWTFAYYVGANAHMLQFAAGVWLGVAWRAKALPSRGAGLMLVGAGFLLLAALQLQGYRPGLLRPLELGGPALLIALGWLGVEADPKGGVPALRPLQRLGDASYAIYLCHTLSAPLVARAVGLERHWLFIPLDVVVGLGAGLACHSLVERPLTGWVRRRLAKDAGPPLIVETSDIERAV